MPRIVLPEDDGVQRDELLQWWYWTGHLDVMDAPASAPPRRFGFEVVFFAVELFSDHLWGQAGQNAISDITANKFVNSEHVWTNGPAIVPNTFTLATPDNTITARGGDGNDTLHSAIGGYTLDVTVRQLMPPVLHYDGQLHKYRFGGNTYYYSRGLMVAEGTLVTPDGESLRVRGKTWFDRQYGELIPAILVGWQWFAIQLDDNTCIMLFDFNHQPEEKYGSITDGAGVTRDLGPADFEVEILDWWKSASSGINYPHKWRVHVLGKEYIITPMMADQEMQGRFWIGPRYWEGACGITHDGASTGQAYVELVGFSYY